MASYLEIVVCRFLRSGTSRSAGVGAPGWRWNRWKSAYARCRHLECADQRQLERRANWLDTTTGLTQVPGASDTVTINQPGITVTVSDAENAGTP